MSAHASGTSALGIFLISKEDAEASDIDPARNAYYDNSTAGLEGYPVALETFHQIHCLVGGARLRRYGDKRCKLLTAILEHVASESVLQY